MTDLSDTQSFCVAKATKVLGDKWTPKILVTLINGPMHFCQIQNTTGINPRTLSLRLSKLVKMGIIIKEDHYSLTKTGEDLVPILINMVEWGKKYKSLVEV